MAKLSKTATPIEILEMALKKEQASYDFYAEVREHATVPIVTALSEQLCEEERRHIRLIESHIAKLRLG